MSLLGVQHHLRESLYYAERFIVVFKKTASQEAINQQADEVSAHGGEVKARYNSIVMKVRTATLWHSYEPTSPGVSDHV